MELQTHSLFMDRPTTDFVSGWRAHIENTGQPETYQKVSNSKPDRSASVILLSEEIKVPTPLRPGGEKVPCPLCSPTSPKFGKGRMAYFPDDRAVRFLGHDCAKRYLGDNYSAAERLFRIEAKCAEYQALWPRLNAGLPTIEYVALRLYGVSKHVLDLREFIDKQADGFAKTFHGDLVAMGGRVVTSASIGAQSHAIDGMEFLAPGFDPEKVASKITAACRDLKSPLPSWAIGDGENEASKEIMRRGKSVVSRLKDLVELREYLVDAASFLKPTNLRRLTRWHEAGLSPYTVLTFKWHGQALEALIESYAGRFQWSILVPSDLLANMPSKDDIEALGLSEIIN